MDKNRKPFELTVTPLDEVPGGAVVACGGFLDSNTVREFDRVLEEHADGGEVRMILDTGALNYISSAGMVSLMRLSRRLPELGGALVLLPPPNRIYTILSLLDLDKVLQIVETRERALELLRESV